MVQLHDFVLSVKFKTRQTHLPVGHQEGRDPGESSRWGKETLGASEVLVLIWALVPQACSLFKVC